MGNHLAKSAKSVLRKLSRRWWRWRRWQGLVGNGVPAVVAATAGARHPVRLDGGRHVGPFGQRHLLGPAGVERLGVRRRRVALRHHRRPVLGHDGPVRTVRRRTAWNSNVYSLTHWVQQKVLGLNVLPQNTDWSFSIACLLSRSGTPAEYWRRLKLGDCRFGST